MRPFVPCRAQLAAASEPVRRLVTGEKQYGGGEEKWRNGRRHLRHVVRRWEEGGVVGSKPHLQ